jgi:hypothetical protein
MACADFILDTRSSVCRVGALRGDYASLCLVPMLGAHVLMYSYIFCTVCGRKLGGVKAG